MIRKYNAGAFAPRGTYLSNKAWEFVQISEDGDFLPAATGAVYYQVPLPLLIVLGPLAGLAFILFLPFAVPLVALYTAAKVIAGNFPWWPHRHTGEELPTTR